MVFFYSGGSEEKGICGDYTKYVEYVCVCSMNAHVWRVRVWQLFHMFGPQLVGHPVELGNTAVDRVPFWHMYACACVSIYCVCARVCGYMRALTGFTIRQSISSPPRKS